MGYALEIWEMVHIQFLNFVTLKITLVGGGLWVGDVCGN